MHAGAPADNTQPLGERKRAIGADSRERLGVPADFVGFCQAHAKRVDLGMDHPRRGRVANHRVRLPLEEAMDDLRVSNHRHRFEEADLLEHVCPHHHVAGMAKPARRRFALEHLPELRLE